jgi:DNA ligase-1
VSGSGSGTAFVELALASQRVASTRSRLQKKATFVETLKQVPREDLAAAVGWLAEEPLCGPLGVGPAHLWELSRSAPPEASSVTLEEVERTLAEAKSGPREALLGRVSELFGRLTQGERDLFVGALTGSLRQGSLAGLMLTALADLFGLEQDAVRRAAMVTGSVSKAAAALVAGGPPPVALELFRPIAPMLASAADSVADAFEQSGGDSGAARLVEWKVDGVRAQAHKQGARVVVFSRQGNDITEGCTAIVDTLKALAAESAVVDGEVVLVGPGGVARPFQDTFSAVASRGPAREGDRLKVYLFDCMHRDGRDLLDEPLSARREAVAAIAPEAIRMPAVDATSTGDAEALLRTSLGAGHEGVMVKDLASPYRSGARGRAWLKVKEFSTVDLVVLAAEWGHGRRKGYLSNLHLGARRDDGSFCMVGKTFKGLTDEMLRWQTERLQLIAVDAGRHVVTVRPELVVEIRYNDVQRSARYPGAVALRFARVFRYREDKPASEADTLASLVERAPEAVPPAREGAPGRQSKKRGKGKAGKASDRQLSLFDK